MTNVPYWTACLYGVLGAVAIAIGGGLVGRGRFAAHESLGLITGMGAGFLLALGALSALPEACARSSSLAMALGVAIVSFAFVLVAHRAGHLRTHDRHAHDHQAAGVHPHAHGDAPHEAAGLSLDDARLAVAGLALHSLLDGVAVSAALASRRELGIFVAVFVVLHKVPEGAAAAAITYASGGTARSARWGVLLVALATTIGALTIFAVGPVLALALSVAAGVTSGVGVGLASHLVKHRTRHGLLGLLLGIALFVGSEALLQA